jgi:DNA-binding MarR family transcriptional regulator
LEGTTVVDVSPYEVGQLYIAMHHRLHRMVDDEMTASGLSLSRAKVLGVLADFGPMNQAALANRLGFAARSVTDTVDSLERDNLAVRQDDPSDRRARIVAITPAGSSALAEAMTTRLRMFDQIFGALDIAQREQLADLLQIINGSLPSGVGPTVSGDCFVK